MVRLASLPCLPDDYQRPQIPSELLLRNQSTESFLGIENFVLKKLHHYLLLFVHQHVRQRIVDHAPRPSMILHLKTKLNWALERAML